MLALTPTQIKQFSWPDLVAAGLEARLLKDKAQWYLGLLALKVTTEYGEKSLKKFADEIFTDPASLAVYRWVVSKFPQITATDSQLTSERLLPFRSYQIAAGTKNPAQAILEAEKNHWTSNVLAAKLKERQEEHVHHWQTVTMEACECGRRRIPLTKLL